MSQITRATLPAASPFGSTRKVSRSGRSTMSDSSIRTNPSIEEPSNMMSPSSALSNWLSGTSTFLLTPRISVNWRRSEETSCFLAASRISRLVVMADRGGKEGGKGGEGDPLLPPPLTPTPRCLAAEKRKKLDRGRREAQAPPTFSHLYFRHGSVRYCVERPPS